MTALRIVGWLIAANLTGLALWVVFRWWADRRRGTFPTPRGPQPIPTDAELRRARKFYVVKGAAFLPTYNDLALVTMDNVPSPEIPMPVPDQALVRLLELHAGSFWVRVVLVVPRPDGSFQYVGEPQDGPLTYRVQFDHDMVWECKPLPGELSDGA